MHAVADLWRCLRQSAFLVAVIFASLAEQSALHLMDSDESEKSRRHFAFSVEKVRSVSF